MASVALPVVERPRTRAECVAGPRPCPHRWCAHHLGTSATETCTLDVAAAGGASLEDVAAHLGGLSRERVRQLETRAIRKLARRGIVLREFAPERADRRFRRNERSLSAPEVDDDVGELAPDEQPAPAHVLDALFDPYVTDEAACGAVFELYERHSREWDDDR